MNILVILPRYNTGSGYHYNPDESAPNYSYYLPSGLAYIIASLKYEGFAVDVINPNHFAGTTRDAIREAFFVKDYDLVFTGGVSLTFPVIRDIIRYVREMSHAKIVVGGGIITAQPDVMLDMLDPDIVVLGEGEQTCVEIAKVIFNNQPLRSVHGIAFKNQHGYHEYTKAREPIENLDTLPIPDYASMGFTEYLEHQQCSFLYDHFDNPRPYPILASRNCVFLCSFCFHTTGRKYRQRSLDNVMLEVEYAVKHYRANMFFFYDELFSHNETRALEFCKRFKAFTDTVPYEISFTIELRVDSITAPMLDALKDAGCTEICLGLESYSDAVLESMHKRITAKQIKTALELITSKGLAPIGNFIFGDPKETLDTAKETLDFFRTRQDILHGCRVAFIIPFQGSAVYREMFGTGRIPTEEWFVKDRAKNGYDFHEPFNMTALSDADFDKLKDMVFVAHYTQGTYVVPDSVTNDSVALTCPFCGEQSTYKNIHPPGYMGLTSIGCRKCNARFEMVSRFYMRVAKPLIETFGFMRLYRLMKFVRGA